MQTTAVTLTTQFCRRDFLTRIRTISRRKKNGRLRACANGHYRIVIAKPPNPVRHSAYEADLPGGGWRDVSAAFRP
ncbi:hypothetical protein [Paraburkholderia phytofirmans]|uniref:hypothetical protein n=1 Tax=Paraburkholderia phytofirmans TaxID=261302 RepID=UPI0038BB4DEC